MTTEYADYSFEAYAISENFVNAFPGILDNYSVPASLAGSFNALDIRRREDAVL